MTLWNGAYSADLAYFKQLTNTWVPGIPESDSPIPGDTSTFQSFGLEDL